MSALDRHSRARVDFAITLVTGAAACIGTPAFDQRWALPLRGVDAAEKLLNTADPPHPQNAALRHAFTVIRGAAALDALELDGDGKLRQEALELLAAIAVLVDGSDDGAASRVVLAPHRVP